MSLALSPLLQAWTFLLCLALGGALGLLYDLLRLPRVLLPFRPLRGLLDLLFWLAVCLTLFLTATCWENGQVRLYTLAALALGSGWYFLLVSPFLRRVLDLVVRPLRKAFLILLAPLAKTAQQVRFSVRKAFSFSLLWSKIYHLRRENPGKSPCPSEPEREANLSVSLKKGWSSWEDSADPASGLHDLFADQCPPGDLRRQGRGGDPDRAVGRTGTVQHRAVQRHRKPR
ncbi:MAG: spore cortex biosynthesis protein YabQ [Ruminiclostridium sp.]|nr:spore cortex biosynthesis protein YabQ [Ruminiclostridium sp.]